jgi:chromate reductase
MKNVKILIITASEKKNLELADKFRQVLEESSANVEILNLLELDLPLYTSRSEEKHNASELLRHHYDSIKVAQGFVFIAPEYNGSTPPVFNNFLAWLSRSSKDWREHLNGKSAVIATFSGGGGFHVLQAMRTQLAFIGMNILGRQILTHMNKPLDEKSLEKVCEELIKHSCLSN